MSGWALRTSRFHRLMRGRPISADCYRLDVNRNYAESAYQIFVELCSRSIKESRRLSLLNALVNLFDITKCVGLGFTTEEFLFCIRLSLVHSFTQIRAAALRAIRHLIVTPRDLQIFNQLQLPYLVCRSLDVILKNEDERIQALKLIRKMLAVSPDIINIVLVRSLVSLGDSGVEDGDRMLRACLSTLCEFGVLNANLLIICGGVKVITRNVLECHSPRIAESLCGVLIHLLEWPHTRKIAGVNLDCLAAPYCDFTYRLGIMDKNKDARDLRFTCSRLALLSVLRSWAGTIEFCNPNKASGLKAIVDVLYLNQLEVRKAVLDLLYELLWLPQLVWTDEYSVALSAIDPADYQDAWRLSEGFVAMEGRNVLPSLANCVPNICEIHTSLLLYCFLETGLLNALVEVIISSDTFISVRATILIGKLLQLMQILLPTDICNISSALPTLIDYAIKGNHQAQSSITALKHLNHMLKNRPASCSLFLDIIIQSGDIINTKLFHREIDNSDKLSFQHQVSSSSSSYSRFGGGTMFDKRRHDSVGSSTSASGSEDATSSSSTSIKRSSIKRNKILQFFESIKQSERLMRDSNVLVNEDGNSWDWEIINALLKSDILVKLDENQIRFMRRLVLFFKPSSNKFSHQDLGHGRHIPTFVTAGIELMDWLLKSSDLESMRLLTDLFSDINSQLLAISTARSAHDCLFSPQHMSSTMCQQYFLFIGRMCRTEKGLTILKNTGIFNQLENLVTSTIHVCYIKLIVSGLDYTLEGMPRAILAKAMTKSERKTGRLYATQFMLVLLRAKLPNIEVWGLPLLIAQTKDIERIVSIAALDILAEATYHKEYLEELVTIWPNFEPLGDQGILVMTRFYSISRGLNHTRAKIKYEIERWKTFYNKHYVLLIEAETHACLTLHSKNEDGSYSKRTCSTRPTIIPTNILPHLYGQLVQTTQGMTNLIKYGDLPQLIDILTQAKCSNESESLQLKSAIWALGHVSTNTQGVEYLSEFHVYEKFINLAKYSDVYSIRSTAIHALGLVSSTNSGANILYKYDWLCVRHNRATLWPICEPEDWLSKYLAPMIRHQSYDVAPYNYTSIEDEHRLVKDTPLIFYSESCDSKDDERTSEVDDEFIKNMPRMLTSFEERTLLPPAAPTPPPQPQPQPQSQPPPVVVPQTISSQVLVHSTPINNNLPISLKQTSSSIPISSKGKFIKHSRSLSETKPPDELNLIVTNQQYGSFRDSSAPSSMNTATTSRTRFNSGTTDSNASCISSYESIYGNKPFISDLQHQTLSPIPSSSNLLDDRKKNEKVRRISLTGASFRDSSSWISPQDLRGYEILRSVRRHQRPMLSESAADELSDILNNITDNYNGKGGGNRLFVNYQQRKLKVRSLDRHSNIVSIGKFDDYHSKTSPMLSRMKRKLSIIETTGPCYSGICLPKNILDLFATQENSSCSYVTHCSQEIDSLNDGVKPQYPFNDILNNEGDESSVSSQSDISSVNQNKSKLPPKWILEHNRSKCLQCCGSKLSRDELLVYRLKMNNNITTTISSGGGGNGESNINLTSSIRKKSITNQNDIEIDDQMNNVDDNNVDTVDAAANKINDLTIKINGGDIVVPDNRNEFSNSVKFVNINQNLLDRVSRNILKQTERMANPVLCKQSKMTLLELKQNYPLCFQDICLYSEVCRALGRNAFRLSARRFLQELFLDLEFYTFYIEPNEILNRKIHENEQNGNFTNSRDDELQIRIADIIQNPNLNTTADTLNTNNFGNSSKNSDIKINNNDNSINYNSSTTSSASPQQPSSSSSSSSLINPLKTLMKSPPLASVYETSIENLCESYGKNTETAINRLNGSDRDSIKIKLSAKNDTNVTNTTSSVDTIITTNTTCRNNLSILTSTIITTTTTTTTTSINNNRYTRPRFNTLELDLSCTKNKFPIRNRTKTDFSPTFSSTTYNSIFSTLTSTSTTSSSQINFTKNLPSSPTTTNLFCEKRLGSAKSEATLIKNPTTTNT